MEAIIVIVGFLGAGKTFLLKKLVSEYLSKGWKPYVILNDYENADLDAQQLQDSLDPSQIQAISGSCICCGGTRELRMQINAIPRRKNAITLIEANGTTDACSLMEILGVGLSEHFLPPIQVSVVDVRNWQARRSNNELEANQVQVSSMIVLNHSSSTSDQTIENVKNEVLKLNPTAIILLMEKLDIKILNGLYPSENTANKLEHAKSHYSSCSVDLPARIYSKHLQKILDLLPEGILRVKGCTKLDEDTYYSYFERVPSGEVYIRPYTGDLITGPKLLVIGPGSDPVGIAELIRRFS